MPTKPSYRETREKPPNRNPVPTQVKAKILSRTKMSVNVQALRAAQAKGLTKGVVPESGTPVLRLEIDDFIQDTELANLYFLALEAFMSHDIYKQPFSYYEISGIHGQPARAWDGVASVRFEPTGQDPNKKTGYCAHGSVLFPVWHRAYLAQFEVSTALKPSIFALTDTLKQALYLLASDIAPKILGDAAQGVLDRFRVPYWDPLLPRQKLLDFDTYVYGIPIIFTVPQILVRRPESPDTLKPMENPLYRFNFPKEDIGSINWSGFTTRLHPQPNGAVKATTIRGYDGTVQQANHGFVMTTFDNKYNPSSTLGSGDPGYLWRVMLGNQDWITMSNHFDPTDHRNKDYSLNSLEGFHDDIHGYLGSGPHSGDRDPQNRNKMIGPSGHMSMPPYAGYDNHLVQGSPGQPRAAVC